jgi:TM2 domain-containing membrane protein YozV
MMCLTGQVVSHRINPLKFPLMTQDLRKYSKQTNTRLIAGGILILFILGDGLIYAFYGGEAAVLGLVCLVAGLFPLLLIWLALVALEWFTRRANRD